LSTVLTDFEYSALSIGIRPVGPDLEVSDTCVRNSLLS